MLETVDRRRACAWLTLLIGVLICALWGPAATFAAGARPHRRAVPKVVRGRDPRAKQSVVGGTATSIARFPFVVALYDPRAGSPAAGFFCGGVILDAIHVATAAHCAVAAGRVDGSGTMTALAGSTRLSPTDSGSVRDPVVAATYDPSYNPTTSDYDVGVLTLGKRLWSGSEPPSLNGVNPIAPLPLDAASAASITGPLSNGSAGAGVSGIAPPVIATVSGWGDVKPAPHGNPSYPLGLQSAQVPLVSDWLCREDYAGIEQTITPRMLCSGGSTAHPADSCYGDSGGPLVVDSDSPARPPGDYVLVGLVDFGNGCAQAGYPGVYVRVANPEIDHFLATGAGRRATVAGRGFKKRKRHRRRKAR